MIYTLYIENFVPSVRTLTKRVFILLTWAYSRRVHVYVYAWPRGRAWSRVLTVVFKICIGRGCMLARLPQCIPAAVHLE